MTGLTKYRIRVAIARLALIAFIAIVGCSWLGVGWAQIVTRTFGLLLVTALAAALIVGFASLARDMFRRPRRDATAGEAEGGDVR